MEEYEIIMLEQTDSTSSYVARNAGSLRHGAVVAAVSQTEGRGQRGNSWEASPGLNVTMSMLLRPESLPVARSFGLSEAVALAVCDTVADTTVGEIAAVIKWPNDIYVGDRKIAGILIENALNGSMVGRSIVGIGLNVNQPQFVSDAPNPVSLRQLTGRDYSVSDVLETLAANVMRRLRQLEAAGAGALHTEYMSRLWRGEGMHPFVETATGERFEASVHGVAPTGHITLLTASGALRTYAFKEVAWPLEATSR